MTAPIGLLDADAQKPTAEVLLITNFQPIGSQ
jgi:hypothetical protein